MGIPIDPEDYEYADGCGFAFDGPTPKFLYARLTGMIQGEDHLPHCPDPPNDIWKLTQNVEVPCNWFFEDANWHFSIRFLDDRTTFGIIAKCEDWHCFTDTQPPRYFTFENEILCPQAMWYCGGLVAVTWIEPASKGSLSSMAEDLNITLGPDTMGDVLTVSDHEMVLRIAKLDEFINICNILDFA